jgi:glucose/arabinose dehydrogenase
MRNTAFALVFVAACGGSGSNNGKKDGGDQPPEDAAPEHDAPPLLGCTPRNGTTISLRMIGQVSGSAVLVTAPKNDGRLFVVEQLGRIRIFENEVLNPTAYLDLSNIVSGGSPPNEQGLLGLAFHPNFATNRQFFVYYTAMNANIVARYTQSASDPNKADPTGEVILSIPDFASNHNGGMIEFGPDGYLYIGTGDGGGGGDPCRNSQAVDRTSTACQNPPRGQDLCPASVSACEPLLGKILRIDVNTTTGNKKYGIPNDNPFATGGGEPEIYVIGLRNPWRWSFDRETGDMYIGDVGQGAQEEVTVLKAGQQKGANLGWSKYEGNVCYASNYTPCTDGQFNSNGMTGPQLVRVRNTGWISVIGGQVYRGSCFPDLRGQYIFADYSAANNAFVRATLDGGGALTPANIPHPTNWPGQRTSIHADARGELFLTTTNGRVFQIEAGP